MKARAKATSLTLHSEAGKLKEKEQNAMNEMSNNEKYHKNIKSMMQTRNSMNERGTKTKVNQTNGKMAGKWSTKFRVSD